MNLLRGYQQPVQADKIQPFIGHGGAVSPPLFRRNLKRVGRKCERRNFDPLVAQTPQCAAHAAERLALEGLIAHGITKRFAHRY